MRWVVVAVLISAGAQAQGFGVEVSGSVNTLLPQSPAFQSYELSLNARFFAGLELWARGGVALISEQPFAQFSLTSVWRTPSIETGRFRWNLGIGLGAAGRLVCFSSVCAVNLGPRHELMPTVEYVTSGVARPYVALNGAIALLGGAMISVWMSGGLAAGVHFDFGEK